MNKRLRFVTRSIVASATLIPVVASAGNALAAEYNYNNYYQPSYSSRNNRTTRNTRTNRRNTATRANTYNNYNYGYDNYNYGYNNYNYGYNNYNYGYDYNYGYNNYNYGYDYNYGYNNWNGYDYGYNNNYGYNNWNSYNGLSSDPNYTYWNGNHYYRMSDGTYRIYQNGQWVPVANNNNNNSGYNNLANDSHYRYSNGYHYYVMDNGDYYYYENGEWKFVKVASETPETPKPETPETPVTPEPKPETPETPVTPEPKPETPETPVTPEPKPETPETPVTPEPKPETPETPVTPEPKPETPETPVTPEPKPETPETPVTPEPKPETPETPVTPEPKPETPETPVTPEPKPETPETPVTPEPKPETPETPVTPEPKPETPETPVTPEPKPETPETPVTPEPKPETPETPVTPEPKPETPETPVTPEPKPETPETPKPEEPKPDFNGTGLSAVDPNYDRTGTALDPNIKPDLTNEYATDLQPIPDVLDKGLSEADYKDPRYKYENGHHYFNYEDGKVYIYDPSTGNWKYVRTVPKEEGTKPALETTDKPSESLIPAYTEKPAENLEELDWAPKPPTWTSIPKPPGKPGDKELEKDDNYVYDESTGKHYYLLNKNAAVDGIDSYYEWWGTHWKLKGMGVTDPDDPAIDPELHKKVEWHEYAYDDDKSTFKLWSENVIGKGEANKPLPFTNLREFRAYVEKNAMPKYLDNAGYNAKVTYKIEDLRNFNNAVRAAWARDYVLTATLSSSVKGYETEFGEIKFIYRVEGNENSNFANLSKAKQAFNKINELRKAEGLKALTWSDDIYKNESLPAANKLGVKYEDTGINFRRESNPETVAKKWVNSGLGELLLDPNHTHGSVAAIQNGEGTYYWVFNSK